MAKRKSSESRKFWHLSLKSWIILVLLAVLGWVFYSIFFVRRETVDYLPQHTITVAAPSFFASAHSLGNPLPIHGNRITLLHNGNGIFPVLLEAIKGAQKTVNFEAFLFNSGTVGSQFRDAFCERARAGVEVRVLLDGLGSSSELENSDVKMMEEAGCKFAYYHPAKSWRIDQSNRRTHRRIMVVDGMVGFTGGVGFADHWQGNGEAKEEWRDVHAKIEGPLVTQLQADFQQHWLKATGEALAGPSQFPDIPAVGPMTAQVVASSSFSYAPLHWLLALSIASAEKRIWITNSYCVPSDQQTELLVQAAKRGVDVRFIIPSEEHNDQPTTGIAGRHSYEKLVAGGVKIYQYTPAMVHSKTVVVDSLFSIFGSSNFDPRSFEINEELDVTVYNPEFAAEMERVFLADQSKSRLCTLEEFQNQSWWDRVKEFFVLPFRSQV